MPDGLLACAQDKAFPCSALRKGSITVRRAKVHHIILLKSFYKYFSKKMTTHKKIYQ